jgi:hypothetical protein
MHAKKPLVPIPIFDLVIACIITISISSVALLMGNVFDPWRAITCGILLLLLALKFFNVRVVLRDERFGFGILAILLIALFFRLEPYLYVLGGQDEGIYVNMSAWYDRHGSTFIQDMVREQLDDKGKKVYDRENQFELFRDSKIAGAGLVSSGKMNGQLLRYAPGEAEGIHVPGVFIQDLTKSTYVFQFYPLHPLWMSLFGRLFGDSSRVYSLLFFSLLSIVFFYLLGKELSVNKAFPSCLVALFLALNPLHAFFSKFPVSEIVMLFFSSAGFYYLLKYCADSQELKRSFYLIMSAGLFWCLFMTRITGFMYLPFFFCLWIFSFFPAGARDIRQSLTRYGIVIAVVFSFSALYGLFYSYPYWATIYAQMTAIFLNSRGGFATLPAVAAAAIIIALLFKNFLISDQSLRRVLYAIPYIAAAVILFGAYNDLTQACQRLVAKSFLSRAPQFQWPAVWELLKSSTSYTIVSHISPLGALVLLSAIFFRFKQKNFFPYLVLLFVALFWYYYANFKYITVLHQYYYARYFVSEIVPYALLFICLLLGDWYYRNSAGKSVSIILAAAMSIYFLYFAAFQLQGRECEGAYDAINHITRQVNKDDLLITAVDDYALQTPLKYYADRNVWYIERAPSIPLAIFKKMNASYSRLFVLASHPLEKSSYLDLEAMIPYNVSFFERVNRIPKALIEERSVLFLYRFDKIRYAFAVAKTVLPSYTLWNNIYQDSLWTNGDAFITDISLNIEPADRYLVLNTRGINIFKNDLKRLNLRLFINSREVPLKAVMNNSYYFEIPQDISRIQQIRVTSSTFIPQRMPNVFGANNDTRVLGIDIDSLTIEKNIPP